MATCNICCEDMRKPVSCNLCNYTACYKCFSRFIINCTINPKCMKCEKPWSKKSLVDGFGQYFVTHKYKKKRENVLFDLENALLPATLPYAIRIRKLKAFNKDIDDIREKIKTYRFSLASMTMIAWDDENEVVEYCKKRKDIRMNIHSLTEDIDAILIKINLIQGRKIKEEKKPNTLVVKCPTESCRGYIDSSKMKCEMCEVTLCKTCHVMDTDTHECKKDDIDTVKLLFTNTKNCPSCKALIFKIDGCDQMYCTQCHTAFSWRTQEIVNGRIHNPHYYEYMRRRGTEAPREIGDITCGGIPDIRLLYNMYGNQTPLASVHRICVHVQFVEIPTYRTNTIDDNRDLRISYLNNMLDIHTFKAELHRREKANEKKREISTILNTFVVVGSDVFRRILTEKIDTTISMKEFESIREYTNEMLRDVSRVFKCVVPCVTEYWEVVRTRHE